VKTIFLLVLACLVLPAQTQDPAADPAAIQESDYAYRALRQKRYLEAIDHFRRAVGLAPRQASIRKDLGYAYLKAGESEFARESFEQALTLDPADDHIALELAFLCHDTSQEGRALELFSRLRRSGDPQIQKTAGEAFARVDGALQQAIERWSSAVAQDPANRAARLELARNLEKHREAARAAEQYLAAWRLPPPREETLLDLARARHEAGDAEGAAGAWLLAVRSRDTRFAERARSHLPDRAPFANEYKSALDLDPSHTGLRRDLAFLWLAVGQQDESLREFEAVVAQDPRDLLAAAQLAFLYQQRGETARAAPLLERVSQGPDAELASRARQVLGVAGQQELAAPHKALGLKSLALSYLNDARRELLIAHETDPEDYEVTYKLGMVYNQLHDDREAVKYFQLAMESPHPEQAAEARRAYHNLAPALKRVQISLWMLPLFSTRYHDIFHYVQLKAELHVGRLPVRPYLSLRLVGDWKQKTAEPLPQFLSESSLIAAAGLRTPMWHGFLLWGEAGQAMSYRKDRPLGTPRVGPDYRGGLSWFRNLGASLGGAEAGPFAEFNTDAVFLSRYQNNVITYFQSRQGYRLPNLGWLRTGLLWNSNVTFDRRREYYANFVEFGPGVRFRVPGISPPMDVTISGLRGVYLLNQFNPRRPNFYDLRIGLWYSMAH
jgi:tetratricopeptide (TPR) repeat protein